jgi:transposase
MGTMSINGFNKMDLLPKLKTVGPYAYHAMTLVSHVFKEEFKDIICSLNVKYAGVVRGRPAYPREMLLLVVLCAYSLRIFSPSLIARECELNKIFQIICCGRTPSEKVIRVFIDEIPLDVMEKIFISTLEVAFDYDFLDIDVVIFDGSIAISSGSKHNKIYPEELEVLIKAKKYGILLTKRKHKLAYIKDIEKLITRNENNPEIVDLLKFMMIKPHLYTKKMGLKIDKFKKEFKKPDKPKYLFANNPESRMMKLKNVKGFDAAVNVQISKNIKHIILSCLVSSLVSDNQLFSIVLDDFMKNMELLEETILKNNNETLSKDEFKAFKTELILFLADNGYFTNEALEYINDNDINAIIDTRLKILAENEEYYLTPEEIEKIPDIGAKKHLKEDPNADVKRCCQNEDFVLFDVKIAKVESNKRKNLKDEEIIRDYIYKNTSCANCKYKEKCANGKDFKIVKDRISPLNKQMRQKRHTKENDEAYKKRWSIIESIFGYLKGADKVMRFIFKDIINMQKELFLISTSYNLKRICKLKDTRY